MKFGVLIVRDDAAGVEYANRLRLAAVPTWTATTDFELEWLMERASVRPSLALIDLRPLTTERLARVANLASLVTASTLPTLLIGAHDGEQAFFRDVRATFSADADPEQVLATVHANL